MSIWEDFKLSRPWKEMEATVIERQRMILANLLTACKTVEELNFLQAEYATCSWFLTLPALFLEEKEKTDEKA